MKAFLMILTALLLVNCSNKNFSADTQTSLDEDTIVDDLPDTPNEDPDDQDDDDETEDDGEICPRYDLVVKSVHQNDKKLNFVFNFNGEMTFKSTEGEINIQFNKPKYSTCSGDYTNTNILQNLNPLQTVEDLTAEVLITHDVVCAAVVPEREITISVLDNATGKVLFSEKKLREDFGACEFGYSTTGNNLRNKLISLADGVANALGAACN